MAAQLHTVTIDGLGTFTEVSVRASGEIVIEFTLDEFSTDRVNLLHKAAAKVSTTRRAYVTHKRGEMSGKITLEFDTKRMRANRRHRNMHSAMERFLEGLVTTMAKSKAPHKGASPQFVNAPASVR